jgi:hypothetical protein
MSTEWDLCGLQIFNKESAIEAESVTERVGMVGALASVSLDIPTME